MYEETLINVNTGRRVRADGGEPAEPGRKRLRATPGL